MVDQKAYTTQQILKEIAALRGQIAHIQQNLNINNLTLSGILNANAGAAILGQVTITPDSGGFTGNPVIALVDPNSFNITQNTATNITKAYSVPGGDAQAGTTYRVSTWGTGTQGSTAQQPTFYINGFGSSKSINIPSSFCAINTGFEIYATGTLQITATGSSGKAQYVIAVWARQSGSSTPSNLAAIAGNVTVNTTTATTVGIQASWGSTTGAPTVSSFGSTCERIGP